MHRLASIILLLTFLAAGSGLTQYVHERQHEWQDAALAGNGLPGKPVSNPPIHNDANCVIHAQLHMPVVSVAWLPPTLEVGVLAIAPMALDQAPLAQNHPDRIDCRGPPAC